MGHGPGPLRDRLRPMPLPALTHRLGRGGQGQGGCIPAERMGPSPADTAGCVWIDVRGSAEALRGHPEPVCRRPGHPEAGHFRSGGRYRNSAGKSRFGRTKVRPRKGRFPPAEDTGALTRSVLPARAHDSGQESDAGADTPPGAFRSPVLHGTHADRTLPAQGLSACEERHPATGRHRCPGPGRNLPRPHLVRRQPVLYAAALALGLFRFRKVQFRPHRQRLLLHRRWRPGWRRTVLGQRRGPVRRPHLVRRHRIPSPGAPGRVCRRRIRQGGTGLAGRRPPVGARK